MTDIYKEIGRRLLEARKRRDWSQEYVAKLSENKFSNQAISYYESGDRRIDLNKLNELGKIYGITIDFLLAGIEEGKDLVNISSLSKEDKRYVLELVARLKRAKPPPTQEAGSLKRKGEQSQSATG